MDKRTLPIIPRRQWLAMRHNGGSLSRFYARRGVFVPLPIVKQGKGRNGAKAARRKLSKEWRAIK